MSRLFLILPQDYIGKKREMFFTQFLHRAKDEEMKRLESLATAEKMQLQLQEKQIVDKARAFDAFLKVALESERLMMTVMRTKRRIQVGFLRGSLARLL